MCAIELTALNQGEKKFERITRNIKLGKHPVDERIKLVQELWDSIASDQKALPVTDEQKVELDKRLDAYDTDGDTGRLASDSIAEIRRAMIRRFPFCTYFLVEDTTIVVVAVMHGSRNPLHWKSRA